MRLLLQLYQNRRSERRGSLRDDPAPLGTLERGGTLHHEVPSGRRGAFRGAADALQAVPVRQDHGKNGKTINQ